VKATEAGDNMVICHCHMTHNATRKEHSFSGASPFDVEDLVVDLIY
jgi:hypothetical protein